MAKDAKLEYAGFYWVPFIPEAVYDFMVTHRPWGPEAEIGFYQCLVHKFGPAKVCPLFEDYPLPRPK